MQRGVEGAGHRTRDSRTGDVTVVHLWLSHPWRLLPAVQRRNSVSIAPHLQSAGNASLALAVIPPSKPIA